ncbi:MAG: hypothetical protein HYY16_13230 [Planctomycetes bacterium]|nr:hypothetical protein [Planctomycetota bacterium]
MRANLPVAGEDARAAAEPKKEWLDRAISLEPNSARFYGRRAALCRTLGDWSAALADLDEAAEIAPEMMSVPMSRAETFWRMGIIDLAQRNVQAVLSRRQNLSRPYELRALLQLHPHILTPEKAPPELVAHAMKDLDEAVTRESHAGSARLTRASVRRTFLNDEEGAVADMNALRKEHSEVPGEGLNHEYLSEILPMLPGEAEAERVRDGCLRYAELLCRKIKAGADRQATLDIVVPILERAFELGATRLSEGHASIKDEPAVRAVIDKYHSYPVLLYKILYDGEKPADAASIVQEIRKRLLLRINRRGYPQASITTREHEYLLIRIPSADRDTVERYKALFRELAQRGSRLVFKVVADQQTHERWRSTKQIPEGYEAIRHELEESLFYREPWLKDEFLVRSVPVATDMDITYATANPPQPQPDGPPPWKVDLTLSAEAGRAFDQAAAELFAQDPKGHIAIILDGKVLSAPAVQSDIFGGSMIITGNPTETAARDLAQDLRSGIRYPIGRPGEPGEPVEEIWPHK